MWTANWDIEDFVLNDSKNFQTSIKYYVSFESSFKPNYLQLVMTWQMNKTVIGVTLTSLWNPELICGNTTTTK